MLDSLYSQDIDFNDYDSSYYEQEFKMFKDQSKSGGGGGSSGSSYDSGNSAVLDRPPPDTEMGGGGGDGPGSGSGSGGGGGAGDGGDGGGEKERPKDNRRVLEEDKYAFKGMFAKDIVGRILPSPEGSFLAEIANINMIRDVTSKSMPFKPAYDLETKRMHFYVSKETFGQNVVEKFQDLTNEDNGMF